MSTMETFPFLLIVLFQRTVEHMGFIFLKPIIIRPYRSADDSDSPYDILKPA